MNVDFERELINGITPYLSQNTFADAKLAISIICSKYEIQERNTELAIYEGDVNDQALAKFLMAKAARGLSKRTIRYYKDSIRMTLDKISKRYDEVTADDIRLYLAVRVQQDKVSKTTANNERRNLSAFYTWLQKEEILLKNPMAKVEVIKEQKKKKKAFSQMEIEKIRNACKTEREKALVEILISTWARVSEVARIRIDEVEGNSIIVHGKGSKDRETFLTPKAILAIENYMNERKDNNPFLFPRYVGVSAGDRTKRNRMNQWYTDPENVIEGHSDASTIENIIRNIGKRAGVANVHPHRFRRTGATMALQAGMELVTVSKLLGHANIGTTQIYLDISDEDLQASHKKYV